MYGYISNVDTAWSCTAYFRYSGLAWNISSSAGRFNWGNLINSTGVACNFVVGSTDYVKANSTTDCPDTDAEYAMAATLSAQRVYQADVSHNGEGDFSFVQADCGTYYGAEPIQGTEASPESFSTSNVGNRPGSNCDPLTLDGQGTSQTVTYDSTAPSINFDVPPAGGPIVVPSAFYGVQFDATDAVAGFGGSNGWSLQRQQATWSGSACGTFANDTGTNALVTGTTNASNQVSGQSLALATCYRWTLAATDQNGNGAAAITSGSIRTDTSGVLGDQSQFASEDWDLGSGDELKVSTGSGNALVTHPFCSLPIRGGGSVDVTATYNSHDTANVGVGPGWRLDVFRGLTINADSTVTFTDEDGSRHTFINPVVNGSVTTYTRPATLYATLVKDTTQTAHEFTLTYRDQSKDRFDISSSIGRLETSEDRFGNAVIYTYYASTDNLYRATDPAGRYVEFTWDTAPTPDRLTSFSDWAYVSGGVVQTTATGSLRQYRLFYDGSGNLAGWSDPVDTSGSCPTNGSHLTCLSYTSGLLTSIAKTQTVTTISGNPAVLGTTTRSPITTTIAYTFADATTVKDAQETFNGTTGTVFSHPAAGQTKVVRQGSPATTATYGLVSATDSLGRNQSVWRTHSPNTIEQRTIYDSTYPLEPASVTDNYGGSPARTVSYTYVVSSLGLVSRKTEPLDASNNRTTDYVYNSNNDVTQKTVALNASTPNTISRYCYSASTCATSDNDPKLLKQIDNYVDGVAGNGTEPHAQDITATYQYDAYGQRTRETRSNYNAAGSLLDSRAIGYAFDGNGNLTSQFANYIDGTVSSSGDDVTPNATTNARTDLTTVSTYDTAGNRVSSADPRRAIEVATAGTTYASDSFSRTVTDAWGTADLGGTWSNTDATFDVNGSAGTIALASATNKNAYLTSVSAHDQELLVKIRVDQLAAGGDTFTWFYLRRQDASNFYEARVTFTAAQQIRLAFRKTVGGTASSIGSSFTTAEAHTTSGDYWARFRLSGTTSVNLKGRLWRDGTTEPVTWGLDQSDASPPAALQGNGHIGLRFQATGTGTYPVTATYDDLALTSIGGYASVGPDDFVTRWTYDGLNERLTETTPATPNLLITQKTQTSTYDELGNVRSATDFGGLITATEFDRVGRATQTFEDPDAGTTYPADIVSISTYDASGRVLTVKDQRQADDSSLGYDQSSYDDLGRRQAQASGVGTSVATETDYAYDDLDRQSTVITGVADSTAQTTVTTFDLGGRATKIDDEFTCTSRTFDYRDLEQTRVEGQASGSCSGAGIRTVTNAYDGLGRPTASTVTAGQGLNDKPVDQVFDAAGNTLTSSSFVAATSTTITVTNTVNPLDQVVSEVRSTGTWAKTNYDAAGNATDRCLWTSAPTDPCLAAGSTFGSPQPSSVTTTRYDARNNRWELVDAVADSTTTYDPDHNYQVGAFYVRTGGGKEHQTLNGYDERHRLTSVTHKLCSIVEHPCSGLNTLSTTGSDAYAYDVNDNRTQVNEANGNATVDRYYCYDAVDRITSTRSAAGCSTGLLEDYTYDDSGNRTKAGAVTFTYDAQGQLASCSSGCGTVDHDAAGNLSKLNGWFFDYDSDGRLIHACQSTSCAGSITKLEFAYDGEGHRTQIKEYTTGTLAKTWDFRYQGDAIVEEKLTDAGHPSGTVVRTYVVDEDGSIVKLTIPAGETDAGTYLVTWNGHGDALALYRIDAATGALTLANSYTYTTWGAPTTATHNGSGDLGFRFLYVGEYDVQWDNAYGLGLAYMHARHYSPALGRFLQPDPDGDEANLYAYVKDNPVTEIDPEGTCFIVCGIINAVIDTAIYLARTDRSQWSWQGAAVAAGTGFVTGALGFGLLSKLSKFGAVARFASRFTGFASRFSNAVNRGRTFVSSIARRGFTAARSRASAAWNRVRSIQWRGGEIRFGPNFRVAPTFRIRAPNLKWFQRLPHYHRRGPGGIGRHRPWEPRAGDKHWWNRF